MASEDVNGTGAECYQNETVGEAEQSNEGGGSDVPFDNHKLFVGGLNWETTEQKLKEHFGKYGTVAEVNLKFDPVTKRSRGFAFIIFQEDGAVDRALMDGPHVIDDKRIDAKKAIPHAIHQQMKLRTKKIFVGGVPTDMPEETIKGYFLQFGSIEEVALVTDKGSNRRRGFCFVTFDSENSVDKCTTTNFHNIGTTEVEVKRATPREQDKRQSAGPPYHGGGGSWRGGGGGGGRGGGFGAGGGGRGGGGGHWGGPYGGYAAYYNYPGNYGGGGHYGGHQSYGGYGGYGGYGYEYGGYRRDDTGAGYNSRYGPMRSNQGHGHGGHGGGAYHPYSR